MRLTRRQIEKAIRRHKPKLRRQYGVRTPGLFGSCARGEQRPKSDIDIFVECEAPIGPLRFTQIERNLGEILGTKVDLVMKSA